MEEQGYNDKFLDRTRPTSFTQTRGGRIDKVKDLAPAPPGGSWEEMEREISNQAARTFFNERQNLASTKLAYFKEN